MKKFISILTVIALTLSFNVQAYNFDVINNDEIINSTTEVYEYNDGSYIINYPIEIQNDVFQSSVACNNEKITTIRDNNSNTITYIYTINENNADILIKQNTYPLSDNKNNTTEFVIATINSRTEPTFGYGYYYNTDSAYLDNYWRLYCPDATPSSNYFFTAIDSAEQVQCENFVLDVHAMETQAIIAEQEMSESNFQIVINALELISAFPTVSEILSTILSYTHNITGNDAMQALYEYKASAFAHYEYCL